MRIPPHSGTDSENTRAGCPKHSGTEIGAERRIGGQVVGSCLELMPFLLRIDGPLSQSS